MIIVQDSDKNILICASTLPNAMSFLGIPKVKYDYLRKKIHSFGEDKPVKYKGYIFTKTAVYKG